jgi:hypothetical protein
MSCRSCCPECRGHVVYQDIKPARVFYLLISCECRVSESADSQFIFALCFTSESQSLPLQKNGTYIYDFFILVLRPLLRAILIENRFRLKNRKPIFESQSSAIFERRNEDRSLLPYVHFLVFHTRGFLVNFDEFRRNQTAEFV